MPDPGANPELLPSLGRLVRGLSALFWGLPLALIVCVGTARAGWFGPYGIAAPMAATGLLLFGVWQLGAFQRQERPWRSALDRALFLAIVNFGLSPFLCWWNRLPEQPVFGASVAVMGLASLLFLFNINVVLFRLGAMLPDETLRHETRQYTALNRQLLGAMLFLAGVTFIAWRVLVVYARRQSSLRDFVRKLPLDWEVTFQSGFTLSGNWLFWLAACLLCLLPVAMTMALLWKTKEVILDSVFRGK